MGDRVSIRFVNSSNEEWERTSVTLGSHWDGMTLPERARIYAQRLKAENHDDSVASPLDRLEPSTVMVDFIRDLTGGRNERVTGNYRLVATPDDHDNSDNGHHDIELN